MKLMAGIDLHSNNLVVCILDAEGKTKFTKRCACEPGLVLKMLQPFKSALETIAVESTYNWYWLVDALQDAGYNVVLANPAGMKQYEGIKHTNDHSDAHFIADLLRLGILPKGSICPKEIRSVRDMLRRRMLLVQQRTALLLSLQALYNRTTGGNITANQVHSASAQTVEEWFPLPADHKIFGIQKNVIAELNEAIETIEKAILASKANLPGFQTLQTIPGVGKILAMTISLETYDISRFQTPGDYTSYCRCVGASRISNGKKKGENNGKCGNKYLAWAFVEAANFARRYDKQARQFFDRKRSKKLSVVATKALANKLAKAAWYMMTMNQAFDPEKLFGKAAEV